MGGLFIFACTERIGWGVMVVTAGVRGTTKFLHHWVKNYCQALFNLFVAHLAIL